MSYFMREERETLENLLRWIAQLRQQGRYVESIAIINKLLEGITLFYSPIELSAQRIELLLMRAVDKIRAGDYVAALEDYVQLSILITPLPDDSNKKDIQARIFLGFAFIAIENKQWEKTKEYCQSVLDLHNEYQLTAEKFLEKIPVEQEIKKASISSEFSVYGLPCSFFKKQSYLVLGGGICIVAAASSVLYRNFFKM